MKIIISNSSPDPIYEQIVKQVKIQIISGDLDEGDALPSIRKLAKELHISVITTKRAYENLEHEGYIDTVAGKGCFVAGQNKEFLREKRMRIVEEKLSEAIDEARMLGLDIHELKEMLDLLSGEEDSLPGRGTAALTKIENE
jgi:GntR family transcriptional regulator